MCYANSCKHTRADVVLIVDEGDGDFSGLEQVSDEQLVEVEGNLQVVMVQ